MQQWNLSKPIYEQLADRLAAGIVDGEFPEGEPLPDLQRISREHLVNPDMARRALELLRERGWVTLSGKHQGSVGAGAKEAITKFARAHFMETDWPLLRTKLRHLGIGPGDLL